MYNSVLLPGVWIDRRWPLQVGHSTRSLALTQPDAGFALYCIVSLLFLRGLLDLCLPLRTHLLLSLRRPTKARGTCAVRSGNASPFPYSVDQCRASILGSGYKAWRWWQWRSGVAKSRLSRAYESWHSISQRSSKIPEWLRSLPWLPRYLM